MNGKLLVVYGEGGHSTQMNRLIKHLELQKNSIATLVDKEGISKSHTCLEYVVPEARSKYHFNPLAPLTSMLSTAVILVKMLLKYKFTGLISTGPGICVLPAIIFRLLGKKVVYIETWCRFESKSLTGRVMYRIANTFYVQNEELLSLYPNAKYSGRL